MMDGVPDLPALGALFEGFTPQPSRSLHAHPDVVLWLRLMLPEAEPELAGSAGLAALTGIPVVKDPDLERGAWELREGDRVVTSGHVDLPSFVREIPVEPIPFPDLSYHYDTGWQLWRQAVHAALWAPPTPPFTGLSSVI